ncbi:MAG: D-2-hydroxyacid dehydrogenase [Anaerolineales bacterium]|nr:D-2-hydroxyacid dehydrogenase [Anaerolineales bacterium]
MTEQIEVLTTIAFEDALIEKLAAVSPRLHFRVARAAKVEEIPPEIWAMTEVLYTDRIMPAPDAVPNLHWIQFHWAGVDHALDAPLLQKPGLVVTTLSGAAASQVAEYIVMMLLNLGRRLPEAISLQRKESWPNDRWERFKPRELRGSTVGIVGYGSIGRQVARLLQPFDVRILATKRHVMQPEDLGYTFDGMGDAGGYMFLRLYPPEALRSMLKECDFIVITTPLAPHTRNLINAQTLEAVKPGAFLIDVSRGGVVDHTALIAALKEHKLAGAALDVFPKEPLPADSPLWKMPNVILTPHIAGITTHYNERAAVLFAENLSRYLEGLPLYNQVDLAQGY